MDLENLQSDELAKVFSRMSDDELHTSAVHTAEQERKMTLALLRHLNEIERRHLFSKFSLSSLHAYCVNELKMDDGTAGRRVSAARLLRDLPVIEEKILSGSVTLTSVAQAGIFFRKEAKNGTDFDIDEKREVIFELENKSTRDVERILISKSGQPEIHFKERFTPKTETKTEVRLYLDEETMTALERLKEIWSNADPHASFADLIKRAATEAVAKHDPLLKNSKEKVTARESNSAQKSVAILSKAEIKRQIWRRDRGQCTFVDSRTGECCGSKHFLEEDHIEPKAVGGVYSLENIRLRCRAHNQRHAIDWYGLEKMKHHIRPN